MNWWQQLLNVIPAAVNQVGAYFQRRHEVSLKKLESQARIDEARTTATVQAYLARTTADITWEQLSIQNSGWRDEYMTIFLTAIVAMCFVPGLQGYVDRGFFYLNNTPQWFQASFLIVVGSAFGVRAFGGFMDVIRGDTSKSKAPIPDIPVSIDKAKQ